MTEEEIITPFFLKKFKHKYIDRVRFHEVDSFGIVHNIQYFYYLEIAHTEYFREIGIELHSQTFSKEFPVMTVHNSIDFYRPLRFDSLYVVLTRISYIKNSSFQLQSIILNELEELIAFSQKVLVHLNKSRLVPKPLPKRTISLIRLFEKGDVEQMSFSNG